ncbi:MarR family winged helix-turn-helix transcriptional regulator [Lactobacillus acetotolerans]|jgi:DNA-binding MarR family transcriptional regulator|uniref:L-fucose operon regulator n=1 Tax=Lactobacillus acetotolerans TaxID=1600 RepID=A0A0D6A3N1_9LACO|nr:MarR family winged helix-turn-helix transcriptional regulator [Lactobacillus acetotolerans]KRN41998.1 L-fucose operon regulator [Lactobacillus acetotolerans DSM 20749 = JCM 3825]MBN7276554.1 winged helix-turn-helix transcriptional regulator [Lactobacillus acetotolerans]QFG51317.1 winged helix-turn-helix transcriptional regulator [Lactobacillus acetotolerans]BAQ57284.1 L-fucose operon regulator [Lactobacillus acetotolerans]GGV08726.1 MarR family transcriptional regulator [Lactobacillus aceto
MDILSFSTIADQIKREVNHKCGLNISQTRILLFFDKNNNKALTMGNLANELNISLSTLSRQLQQKKTQNFIKVNKSEKDSSKSVKLNNRGLKKASELKTALKQIETILFSFLDEEEFNNFTKQLSTVAKSSNEISTD